mgnify:CR=1 FL=1
MSKNLKFFIVGFVVLVFILFLFQSKSTIQEKSEPTIVKKMPNVVTPEKKVNDVTSVEKEIKQETPGHIKKRD